MPSKVNPSASIRSNDEVPRLERSLNLRELGIALFLCVLCIFALYYWFVPTVWMAALTTVLMFGASFLFVAVASYICGLVGSSNSPVSGMTISALLGTAVVFLLLGVEGESAALATLGVAAVVCCAACTSGDCSQDLKTGYLVQATPRSQQIAQIIGVTLPALVIAPVLTLLHQAYGIGEQLQAPQAMLFASLTQGIFGKGELPLAFIFIGLGIGLAIVLADQILAQKQSSFRLHIMPVAVGLYLPITLAIPILLGGVIRLLSDRKKQSSTKGGEGESLDQGILMGSGLIAGEALLGVVVAAFLYFQIPLEVDGIPGGLSSLASAFVMGGILYWLYRAARQTHS